MNTITFHPLPIQKCLAQFSYGWGKQFKLYSNVIEMEGTIWPVNSLTYVKPSYHNFLGRSIGRLKLHFNDGTIINLRGIEDINSLRTAVDLVFTGMPDLKQLSKQPEPLVNSSLSNLFASIQLRPDEIEIHTSAVIMSESRHLHQNHNVPYRSTLMKVDAGILTLTSSRIIFIGRSTYWSTELHQVRKIEQFLDAIGLHEYSQSQRRVFEMSNSAEFKRQFDLARKSMHLTPFLVTI